MTNEKARDWTFGTIAPRFGIYDRAKTLSFYEKLGFRVTLDDDRFVIIRRDGVDIHLNVNDRPVTNRSVCWIGVSGIEVLYEQCLSNHMVRFPLETKPYGLKEFGVSDPSRNLIIFAEAISKS